MGLLCMYEPDAKARLLFDKTYYNAPSYDTRNTSTFIRNVAVPEQGKLFPSEVKSRVKVASGQRWDERRTEKRGYKQHENIQF